MRVRLQSYLLPAALVVFMFFCATAYSEKKNNVYLEDADKGVKNYNSDYKKRAAGSSGDIISYNSRNKTDDEYDEYNNREELIKPKSKNESGITKTNVIKKNSAPKNLNEFSCYIVKKGDTLFSIAKRSGVNLKKIQDLNNFNEDSSIYKGMKIKIPSGKGNKKNIIESTDKVAAGSKPLFLWPLKRVKGCSRDGKDGVKAIGLIIKGTPGSDVIASENGVVKKVGYMRGYGKYIVVKHGKKYITVYSNLLKVDVKAGEAVQKGGVIGNISDDMTLHFQIDKEGKPENPLSLLPGR